MPLLSPFIPQSCELPPRARPEGCQPPPRPRGAGPAAESGAGATCGAKPKLGGWCPGPPGSLGSPRGAGVAHGGRWGRWRPAPASLCPRRRAAGDTCAAGAVPHSPRPPLAATHSHSWLPPRLPSGAVCGVRASTATQARRTGSLSAAGIPPGSPKPARRLVEVGQGYRALPRGDGQPGSTSRFGVSSRSPWEGETPSILSAVAAPRRAAGLLLGEGTAVDIGFSSAAGLSPAGVLSVGFLHLAGLSGSSRQQGRTGFTCPKIFVSLNSSKMEALRPGGAGAISISGFL